MSDHFKKLTIIFVIPCSSQKPYILQMATWKQSLLFSRFTYVFVFYLQSVRTYPYEENFKDQVFSDNRVNTKFTSLKITT